MKKNTLLVLVGLLLCLCKQGYTQGTWTQIPNFAPDSNEGNMILLSDGRVLAKTSAGGIDRYGNVWDVLTPDSTGSYINGTWSSIAPMHGTRLYYSSQMLK